MQEPVDGGGGERLGHELVEAGPGGRVTRARAHGAGLISARLCPAGPQARGRVRAVSAGSDGLGGSIGTATAASAREERE
jgi:hypothetical protein